MTFIEGKKTNFQLILTKTSLQTYLRHEKFTLKLFLAFTKNSILAYIFYFEIISITFFGTYANEKVTKKFQNVMTGSIINNKIIKYKFCEFDRHQCQSI